MPQLPAFCNSCGTAFPSGMEARNSSITISNFVSGPCPNCGGTGRVPDGLYNVTGDTIQILANSQRSVSDLQRISGLLESAKQRGAPVEEIASTLKREMPELASLADALPKTRTELYALVAIVITVIGILINALTRNESPRIEVEQVINNVAAQAEPRRGVSKPSAIPAKKKVGRNEPCPCGSGKKYKKCCGA